jgi:ABC-type phosphate/phosphonate transport system permease subunit
VSDTVVQLQHVAKSAQMIVVVLAVIVIDPVSARLRKALV